MINFAQVRKYCHEDIKKIENYDAAIADKTQIWHCHHRAEVLQCGNYSAKNLKKFSLYYHRPASELIFLTASEHHKLHSLNMSNDWHKKLSKNAKIGGMLGKRHSDKAKQKMSKSHKGLPSPMKGRHYQHSDKTKRRMSESHKGKVWINNGVKSTQCFPENIPLGWVKGRLRKVT